MSDVKELKQAQTVFKSLCQSLDELEIKYEKKEEDLSISCTIMGNDIQVDIEVEIDRERKLITLLSQLPFIVSESRRAAVAVAISQANNTMIDGSFDYSYLDGKIVFRMTSSYSESIIGKELLKYMIACSFCTIDEYNDKFLVIAKTKMSTNEILDYIDSDIE